MTKSKKLPTPTRDSYLAELGTRFGDDRVKPDEITVQMMVDANPSMTKDRARDVLRKAQAAGELAAPVVRRQNGVRVLAWARKG